MNEDFLKKLQKEAQSQQKLYNSRIIPQAFDPITSFIGENALLTLFVASIFSAVVVKLLTYI